MTARVIGTNFQHLMIAEFYNLAKKHGVGIDFDLSDPNNPIVNFTGGTYEQHESLALELEEKYGDYAI